MQVMKELKKVLAGDREYAWLMHSTIAGTFRDDVFASPEYAHLASQRIMKTLFDVDIEKLCPGHWGAIFGGKK